MPRHDKKKKAVRKEEGGRGEGEGSAVGSADCGVGDMVWGKGREGIGKGV